MRKSLLSLSLALCLVTAPGWAETTPAAEKTPTAYTQTHWNAQLQCQDLGGVSQRLDQLVTKHGGRVNGLNVDMRNGSGNLNARVPEQELTGFCQELQSLGSLTQQNRNLSDNTSSHDDAKRQLALAEKMAGARLTAPPGVSEIDRALFETEFKAYLRDRINSQRNSLNQYEQNRGWAEVSISLQGPSHAQPNFTERRAAQPYDGPPPVPSRIQTPTPPQPPQPPQASNDWMIMGGATLLIGGSLLYLLRRRS